MASSRRRVLAIELNLDLAQLVAAILTEVGFDVTSIVCNPSALATAKALNPDVIILDYEQQGMECSRDLLTALRSDEDTQGIPVVVVSDGGDILDVAQRSFNVQHEIIKPYDVEDLVSAVNAAVAGVPLLPHPSRPATTSVQSVRAADALAHETDRIMVEWLRRVEQANVLGSASVIPIRVLMDNVTAWLVALVSVLRYGPEGAIGSAEIRDKLRGHIVEGKLRGLTIIQIIRQFEILRDVVWEAIEGSRLEKLTTAEVFELGRALNSALDSVLLEVATLYTQPATTGQS